MKYQILFIAFIISSNVNAQVTKEQRIQDSVIGWDAKNKFDKLKPQLTEDRKQKYAIVNKMVEWLKASYVPVGSLGEYQRYINNFGYGLNFQAWNVGYDNVDEQKHFLPVAEENVPAYFSTNRVFGSYAIPFMNKKGEQFFTMQPDGYSANSEEKKIKETMNKTAVANVSQHITWVNEWVTIYITPNKRLPMQAVSKGELLDKAEASFDVVLAEQRKDISGKWPDNIKNQEEAFDVFKKEVDKYRGNIHKLKEKYKNSLNEPAFVVDMQPTFRSFTADSWDIFYGGPNTTYYPVYKFDEATIEKMNGTQPLWLTLAMHYATRSMGNREYELYTAVTENVNYDYIHDYFFAPEKIKNKPYVPANEEQLHARLAAYKTANTKNDNTAAKKQISMPANVLLFDDFAQDNVGNKPGGWYSGNYGKAAAVANVEGIEGNWLKLGANAITPTTLKIFPQNFAIEFDLATDNFSGRWGAALQLQLSGKHKGSDGINYASAIDMSITAGLQSALEEGHDYRGELKVNLINTPSKMAYNDKGGYFSYAQPDFTSIKRKVHVKLQKNGDDLFIFLNNKPVGASKTFLSKYGKPCGDCSIPASIQYNELSIRNVTQDAETVGCYVRNIKITKE